MAMPVRSAGILLWRHREGELQVFIAHMGGPFWARKDAAAWSIPKGEYQPEEGALAAARREFAEEIGVAAPRHEYALLGEFPQSSGKIVTVFHAESDFEVETVHSNTFPAEWPPRSGRIQEFPEIDRAEWMSAADAAWRLVKGQVPLLEALRSAIEAGGTG